jgi:allantoin racemase
MGSFALQVAQAEVNALIISGFGDPGLDVVRKSVAMPVTGLAEAGITEAAQGGRRYSIVTVTPKLLNCLSLSAQIHGKAGKLASIRFTAGALGEVMFTPEKLEEALLQACQIAITQDAAQAIVIGGGPLAAAAAALSKKLHVPVIDPVAAAIRLSYQRYLSSFDAVTN